MCLHTYNEILRIPCLTLIWNRAKSGSGAPGPESAPRGTKSTTFAKGIFQPFILPKFFLNPVREPSFLRNFLSPTVKTFNKIPRPNKTLYSDAFHRANRMLRIPRPNKTVYSDTMQHTHTQNKQCKTNKTNQTKQTQQTTQTNKQTKQSKQNKQNTTNKTNKTNTQAKQTMQNKQKKRHNTHTHTQNKQYKTNKTKQKQTNKQTNKQSNTQYNRIQYKPNQTKQTHNQTIQTKQNKQTNKQTNSHTLQSSVRLTAMLCQTQFLNSEKILFPTSLSSLSLVLSVWTLLSPYISVSGLCI